MESFHPFIVHFPIVLAFLWPVVDLIGALLDKPDVSALGLGLLVLALIASLAATVTGQSAFDAALLHRVAVETLNVHADVANLMPWLLLLLLLLRVVLAHKLKRRGRLAAAMLGLLAWAFVFHVGRTGGALVYEHGVGVGALNQASGKAN